MKVPPDRPLSNQPPAALPSPGQPPRAVADHTYVKPPILPPARLQLDSAQPSARTQITFVEGTAPVTLALTAAQTRQLQNLLQRFPELRGDLERLGREPAAAPRLLAQDKNGTSLLEQLDRLASGTSKVKGVVPAQVVRELVPRLADRQRGFQGPQFTCGSAALENWMNGNDPGELTRIVSDLALTGKSRLRDGSSIDLPSGFEDYLAKRADTRFNHGKDKDVRAMCDVLFQSSVMAEISLVGGNRSWRAPAHNLLDLGTQALGWLTDWARYDPAGDDVGLGSRLSGDGGGDPFLLTNLMQGMTGRNLHFNSLVSGHTSLEKNLQAMHQQGQEMLCLYKQPLHYVLVKDYDPVSRTVSCLSTGTYDSEIERLPLKQFLANCGGLIHE